MKSERVQWILEIANGRAEIAEVGFPEPGWFAESSVEALLHPKAKPKSR